MVHTFDGMVDAPLDEVFAWYARPGAIKRLTPPRLPVRVAAEAASLRDGRAVLALPGGLRWVAQHDPAAYDPPRRFADADYARMMAQVLRRPLRLPVPGLGPRLLLGEEGASELAGADQRVSPRRLLCDGHRFRHPELEPAPLARTCSGLRGQLMEAAACVRRLPCGIEQCCLRS